MKKKRNGGLMEMQLKRGRYLHVRFSITLYDYKTCNWMGLHQSEKYDSC